jgi:predicted amidohydrolase YtcJ
VGRVVTLAGASGLGWADGLAIADGRVIATGDEKELGSFRGARTVTWRLGREQVMMPGTSDAHLHLTTAALAAAELDLSDAPGRTAMEERIRDRHDALPEGAWLLGHGWSIERMGGWPDAALLDRLAPGRPVALWAHDHHSRWASSSALATAAINSSTPDPEGGLIRRDSAGAATGILHEHAAKLLARAIPRPGRDEVAAALDVYAASLARMGVVAAHDPGEMEDDPELRRGPVLYRDLAASGRLPLRVAGSIRPEQVQRAIALGLRSGDVADPIDPSDGRAMRAASRARVGWLKLFADGALGSRSAALLDDYEVEPALKPVGGPRGMLLAPPEVLHERAEQASAAGIAVQIHGIGDAAVRTALDILGGLRAPERGIRHRVEHAQLVHPDDVSRFAALGIAASVQPCHLASDAAGVESAWGKRSAHAFPLAGLAQTGALMPAGTDAPVESPNPWAGIAIAVTRLAPGWAHGRPFHPEQSIDLARSLRAACVDAPLVAGEGDRGRLVPGHRADLIVLPGEVLDEPVRPGGALEQARPLATLIDGDVAWQDPAFDP